MTSALKKSRKNRVENDESSNQNIVGFVETINDQSISGWCCNSQNIEECIALEFVLDGTVLGLAICNQNREDLRELEVGNLACGFNWNIPKNVNRSSLKDIRVRVFGTDVFLEQFISSHSEIVERETDSKLLTVDSVDANGVFGWVNEAGTSEQITLNLHIDGKIVSTHVADTFRKDVRDSGLASGKCGFLIPLPDTLFDGISHQITLEIPALSVRFNVDKHSAVFKRFDDGSYVIEDGIINGKINTRGWPKDKPVELDLYAGAQFLARIPVSQAEGGNSVFQYELPLNLIDGNAHRLTVNIRNSEYRLRAQGGALSVAYSRFIKGKIDKIDTNGITGWVYNVTDLTSSIVLDLYDGEDFVCSVETDITRSDVNKLFNISGKHGFSLVFPEYLYDDQPHYFRLVFQGETLNRKKGLPYPIVLKRDALLAIPKEERYQGYVDLVSVDQIMGWAWDSKNPSTPVHVAVYVDDELVGTTIANRFSARLRTHNRSGHQIFLMHFPSRLMNGRKRNVKAVIVEGDLQLTNKHSPVLFPLVDVFGKQRPVTDAHNFSYSPPSLLPNCQTKQNPIRSNELSSSDDGRPLISIIVLNWNGASILKEFLESFERINWRHSYELILIDHGSVDESLEVAAAFESSLPLQIVPRGMNYSFSASNNYGAKLAKGRYLVFANNDLVMLHDCLSLMREHFNDPEIGAVGLKLLEPMKAGNNQWNYLTHHQGVRFVMGGVAAGIKQPYYVPFEIGEDPTADLAATYNLPVVTGALLMCRKSDFDEIGGFHEGYFYGMEDVDLCLGINLKLGKKVICDTSAVALHNRSATRDSKLHTSDKEKLYNAQIHSKNRKLYIERYGRYLTREIMQSLVKGDKYWRTKPLRVTFVVTDTTINTAAGDFFTALELADSMRRLHGWETMFVSNTTYSIPGTDVLVVMRHDYQLAKVVDGNAGLITIAWVRNRVDEWVAVPYFDAYQLIFCSSYKAIDHIREHTGRESTLLPIATNSRRFAPRTPSQNHASDVTFTGNYWGHEREAIGLQDLQNENYEFAIYGHGWEKRPDWQRNWRGAVPYVNLPEIYSSAKIVLDDSHPVTREWNSLNSRVFDALGCGKLVLTNCEEGAKELFPELLPTFRTDEELQKLIRHYLDNPDEREDLARRLHKEVLEKHTYDCRAITFKDRLTQFAAKSLRFAIKIGVPKREERDAWGDYHFALGIKRALEKQGHFARVDILPEWNSGLTTGDDVVIVLRGLSQYQPQPTAINLMWLISHPDDVTLTELQQYDHVFVASESYTTRVKDRLGDKVSTLLQCTDPALFYKEMNEEIEVPDVIFVGNSRGQRREVVQYALDAGIDFSVYGGMWTNLLPASRLKAEYLPNETLRHYYSAAKVVLNDHWPDMRSEGFISNRIFDAGACGATIVSDDIAACRELFGDAIAYYGSAAELADRVQSSVKDKNGSRTRGEKLRKVIHEKHTFANRVDDILRIVTNVSRLK